MQFIVKLKSLMKINSGPVLNRIQFETLSFLR